VSKRQLRVLFVTFERPQLSGCLAGQEPAVVARDHRNRVAALCRQPLQVNAGC
jgi:hypothetical protein